MQRIFVICSIVSALAVGAVFAACGSSGDGSSTDSGTRCTTQTGPGGACSTIKVCCDNASGDCTVTAASKDIACDHSVCTSDAVVAQIQAACSLSDGDSDTEVVADGDSESQVDGDSDADSDLDSEADSEADSDSEATSEAPAGHTDIQSGVAHMTGKEDPLSHCTSCHGTDLKGGTSGVSCYTCHNSNDHTSSRGGVKHKSGTSSTCNVCHGPSNGGGLGPACSSCHGGK